MKDSITLDQFVDEEHKQLDAFKASYLAENAKKPENWPLDANPGCWDEQLQICDEGCQIK